MHELEHRSVPGQSLSGRLRAYLPLVLTISINIQFAIHYAWKGFPFLDLVLFTGELVPLPYQGRILTAWIFQQTADRASVVQAVASHAAKLPPGLRSPFVLVELVLVFISLLAASLACRATVRLLGGGIAFADWTLLLIPAMMIYLTFFESYGFYAIPYDLPSLAFFSIGIWLVVAQKRLILLPVFVLGTLNRETYIFITFFMLLYPAYAAISQRRSAIQGLRPALPFAVVQIACWIGVRFWVLHRFSAAIPGEAQHGFVLQVTGNLHSLANPLQWPALVDLAALLALPLALGWRWIADRAFAQAAATIVVFWAVGMFLVGVFLEIRIFTELVSFVAPCIAMALWTRFVEPRRDLAVS
ncbi:MAG: hypothetical protein ACRYFU_13405 [Janthinobacterium lividum]